MKRFIIKSIISVVALFGLMWVMDCIITHNLWHSKVQMLDRYNTVYWDDTDYDMIIMGSSRGMVQYSPRILDSILGVNSYNLSCNGRCIDAQCNIFDAYCRNHAKPKTVIQNVDYITLLMSNMYEREQYLPYIKHDRELYEATKETEQFNWSDVAIPLKRYAGYHKMIREGLHIKNKMYNPANEYKGYEGRDREWDGLGFDQIDTIAFETNLEAETIFDNYLSYCKENDIRVVFVFAPIYYGVTQKMGDDEEKMKGTFQKYADRYGIPILDYSHDRINYDTLNFYNATHLNRSGAELFSTKLAHDLKNLLK